MTLPARLLGAAVACAAVLVAPGAAAAQAQLGVPPRSISLNSGWETRVEPAPPADPQPPPPEENAPEAGTPTGPVATPPAAQVAQGPENWRRTSVPNVFDPNATARFYGGTVRRYRVSFTGPDTPPGWSWTLLFESVRRAARVYLNGRLIGGNRDPYTPFTVAARGLKPGQRNDLLVIVDSRKDPKLPEGWWNWGGIVRPVRLVPAGHAELDGLGLMSRVSCRRPASSCKAQVLLDGALERHGGARIDPKVTVRVQSPRGRITKKTFKLPKQRASRRRLQLSMDVPAPVLWSPDRPALYRARVTLRDGKAVQQVVRKQIGLRSVEVKAGLLYLNNRRVILRGASIHEDMPGNGAALSSADMDRIVADLKELGANVTRAHYLMNDRLLSRFDKAGIMVWNQAPVWQRDHGANLLRLPRERNRALLTVRRTVKAARSHPSVITHSVANELTFTPDNRAGSKRFLTAAAQFARDADPTIPISTDIKSRVGIPEQFTYQVFDMLGINQYFGWYKWVEEFGDLGPYLIEMRDLYPSHALVMTEFGSEALPEFAAAATDFKGSFSFQADHTERTLNVVDSAAFLSGAIYWTLREFEIFPGWTGGAPKRAGPNPNTRHHKGLLSYGGQKKPAWHVAHNHFTRTPLYWPPTVQQRRR
jgi:hypothetical protein